MALSKLDSVSPMGMSVTGSPTCEGRARGGFGFFGGEEGSRSKAWHWDEALAA